MDTSLGAKRRFVVSLLERLRARASASRARVEDLRSQIAGLEK
ncbi:hypothetical protein [Streptomyces sp. NPDC059862]